MNNLELNRNWLAIRRKLKQKYCTLSDADLEYVKGHEEQLLTRIQQRLNKYRGEVITIISNMNIQQKRGREKNADYKSFL